MLSRTAKMILVLALVAGSLAIAAPPANAVPTKTVKAASGDVWQPRTTHLDRQGGKGIVKWKNPTNRRGGHNVKSINQGSDWTLKRTFLRNNNGSVAKKTFKRAGTFWFVCTIHAAKVGGEWTGMVGKVKVH
jgi:plastocyanin